MDELQAFRESVAELERVQAAMARVSNSGGENWKREFIELRRQLQAQIGLVARAASDCRRLTTSDVARDIQESLSRMRTAVALHQANWPAVSIVPADPGYIESSASVRAANRAFIDLAQQLLSGEAASSHRPVRSKE